MNGDVVVGRVQEAPVALLWCGFRRNLELLLEHALEERGVLLVAVVWPDPGPGRLQHLQEVEVPGQVRDAAVVAVAVLARFGAQQEGTCDE